MEENMPVLAYGSTGDDVLILQEKLRIVGDYPGISTRSFGSVTEDAVIDFQKRNGLEETGVVDQKTWNLLFEQTKSEFPTRRVNLPVLRLGDSGVFVERLQRELTQVLAYDGPINGIFDQRTHQAVVSFQLINRLTANGVVNIDTWSALMYLYAPLSHCDEELGEEFYIVQQGDTLWSISRMFNTTVENLRSLNQLSTDTISIGQRLRIRESKPEEELMIYTVQRGDSLWALASRFNSSVEELMRINNLTSANLSIGQQLLIPGTSTTPPSGQYTNYTVVRGDSLYAIARRFQTTVDAIMRANNLSSINLSIGQQLRIPMNTSGPNYFWYTVVRGDSLYALGRRFNTTVDAIRRLNNLTTNNLSIGQRLRIPQ